MKRVGKRFRDARTAAGLTQAQAAEAFRKRTKRETFSAQNVCYMEQGDRPIPLHEFPAWAAIYKVKPLDLIGDEIGE